MTVIPEPQLGAIKEASVAAYDDLRWTTGDSPELAAALLHLGAQSWRAGYEIGLQHGRDE